MRISRVWNRELERDYCNYQMYFDILHTSAENFIEVKQSWPLLQLYRIPEVKFKIYTPSFLCTNISKGKVLASQIWFKYDYTSKPDSVIKPEKNS